MKEKIKNIASSMGFDLIGFSEFRHLNKEIFNLNNWLQNGFDAEMKYMSKNLSKRHNIREILPDAKSVISLGLNYYTPHHHENIKEYGKVSRYAWGKDYHLILWEKLDELIKEIKKIQPSFDGKSYVDTGPVMDKAWAVNAGLGWQGKHSNVINDKIGSWFFISNIITNWKFTPDNIIVDHCGDCTRCIDACPTDAIVHDYVVDSNKCISYLTIENKNEIPHELKGKTDNWLFGCDICQDVCPWNNKFSTNSSVEEFQPIISGKEIKLTEFDQKSNSQFAKKYQGSPLLRARKKGMKRNADFLNTSV